MSGYCLVVVWEVSGGCQEGVGMVSGRFPEGVGNFLSFFLLDWDNCT